MTTPNLQLPEVPEAILTASDELNEGLWIQDAVVQLAVISRTTIVPPVSALQGDRYIIPSDAEDLWAGRANHIAYKTPLGWRYFVPRVGWMAWITGETPKKLIVYDSNGWNTLTSGIGNVNAIQTRGATWTRGTAPITTPTNPVDLYFPTSKRITGVVITTSNAPGDCVIDVQKGLLSSFPTMSSICNGNKPEIVNQQSFIDTDLSDWTDTVVNAGEVLRLVLDSAADFSMVAISLILEPA